MIFDFIKISAGDAKAPAAFLAQAIGTALGEGKKVLWFVPGGSAIAVAAAAARSLSEQQETVRLSNLTVTLTDERYGAPKHADSNWQQLLLAGFLIPGARLFPVLSGADIFETAEAYNNRLAVEMPVAYKIALLGIGADGHTAGLLPHSPALSSPDLAAAYRGGRFKRLTITPRALVQLDQAVVYAIGEEKWPALAKLREDVKIEDQPAQILKKISRVTIFTDFKSVT